MYLDPGFGSMVIQFVIAGIAAAGTYLFIIRNKIIRLFKKGTDDKIKSEINNRDEGNEQ